MQGEKHWLGRDRQLAVWLIAIVPFAQIAVLGCDGPILGAWAAALNAAAAGILLAIVRPNASFFRSVAPPFLLFALALGWALWPDIRGDRAARIAPDLVFTEAARPIGFACLLMASAAVGYRRAMLRLSIGTLCVAAMVDLAIGLVLRQHDPATVWGYDKGLLAARFTGTMLNANAMGTVFGATAVLALGGALSALRGGLAVQRSVNAALTLYLLAFGLLLAGAGITGSRTAFIGALAGSGLLLGIHFLSSEGEGTRRAIFVALGVAVATTIVLAAGLGAMQRLPQIETDALGRFDMWRHYATLAWDAPAHGHGLGSFQAVNIAALPPTDLATDLWYVNAAHNFGLQMMIEGGALYAVLSGLAVLAIAFTILFRARNARDARPLMIAIGSSLAVFFAAGMVDVALNIPGPTSLAVVLLGLAWGHALRRGR